MANVDFSGVTTNKNIKAHISVEGNLLAAVKTLKRVAQAEIHASSRLVDVMIDCYFCNLVDSFIFSFFFFHHVERMLEFML